MGEDCVAGVVLWFDIFKKHIRTSSSGDGTNSVFLARLFSTSSKNIFGYPLLLKASKLNTILLLLLAFIRVREMGCSV